MSKTRSTGSACPLGSTWIGWEYELEDMLYVDGRDAGRRGSATGGIETANVSSGRGTGLVKSISYGVWVEVDILTVIVSEGQAEEIFNFIFEKADINRPHGGFIFQGGLTQPTPFVLPDLPEENQD